MSKLTDILIKNIRIQLGFRNWNDSKLADEMGISRQNVSRWMNGHTAPSLENLEKIADALKIPPSSLLEPIDLGPGYSIETTLRSGETLAVALAAAREAVAELTKLPEDEAKLLAAYRAADPAGKRSIRELAEDLAPKKSSKKSGRDTG